MPNGFFVSASGGLAQTSSYYESNWVSIIGNTSSDIKFPTQNGGAANFSLGCQWGFGQINSWKNIFTGLSANYYYFGRAIDPNESTYDKNTVLTTAHTNLYGITAEGFVGMYLSSPLSAQIGLGLGGVIIRES